ncbi:MAG: bifunctional heptose 7-phosphate kinase/heptose 1-phosphate adenyltransferase [bacterium]
MSSDIISKFIRRKQVKNIRIIGDICIDEYIFCEVKSIAKEAPALALHIKETTYEPGQVGNVAFNCSSLGSKLHLYTYLGKDKYGKLLRKFIRNKGISLIEPDVKNIKTTTTHRIKIVSEDEQTGYHHLLHIYNEVKCPDKQRQNLWEKLIEQSDANDIICISDYLLGAVSKEYLTLAINKGLYIIANTRDNLNNFKAIKGIICNYSDIDRLDIKGRMTEKITQARKGLNLEWLVITLGNKGMILCSKEEMIKMDAIKVSVVDITGAGDVCFATIASALSREMDIIESSLLANIAGATSVSLKGTGCITIDLMNEIVRKSNNKE